MIYTPTHNPTLTQYSSRWNPTLKSAKPQLIAHWEKDDNGKLYCRWIKS
ncbi:hypothetical protein PN441_17005 [Spirulina major CS-329]|nr:MULTISPECIES: hypothetical protein [Spirulina]MDB9494459.1 hypothetical protein [Spirulina subsalsa CS-330]MDB9504779.1 hypothetical protein [Spirulina major CS-329]